MPSTRFLTAFEHEAVQISTDGDGQTLTPVEAEQLAQLAEKWPGFCELRRREVRFAQYCGVVGVGERVLEILPKTQSSASSTQECRDVLLRLLRLTGRIPQFQLHAAGQQLRRAPLLDAFIAAFYDAVRSLRRRGLLRQYVEHTDDLTVVRGRIDATRQLTFHANRPDLVTCAFDELTTDNIWNRVLRKAIRCTRPWIRSEALDREWVELMSVLSDVDDAAFRNSDLKRLVFDRRAERYRTAIEWALRILALLSPTFRAGQTGAPALLFNMNQLFESAVAVIAKRELTSASGIDLRVQQATHALATRVGMDRIERAYTLRPDLIFANGQRTVGIADSKWKVLTPDREGRVMPSEADIYQLHAYAAGYRCNDLFLVYPWHAGLRNAAESFYRLPEIGDIAPTVTVVCIDVETDAFPVRMGHWPFGQLAS